MKIAFAGLRHAHIFTLYQAAKAHPQLTVTGAWEADKAAAEAAKEVITEPFYTSYEELLSDPSVDIVAVGDYYGIRGKRVCDALRTGHAVVTDKPLCTSLAEWDAIERLSRERSLPVGCQLELRDDAALRQAAALIRAGELGEIRSVAFTAQHPLQYGVRPGWYFEPGKHGGTLNDIAIHGLDAVAWITGHSYDRTLFARQWNAYATQAPQFADCAQFNGLLQGGAALAGDVSYAAPSPAGFRLPTYWRFTFWGEEGFLECRAGETAVTVARTGDELPRCVEAPPVPPRALEAFLDEVRAGRRSENTAGVLQAARAALQLQQFANDAVEGG